MAIDPVSLAITAAMTAINMAVSASKTIEGPRLKDTAATVADYGTPLNYLVGQRTLPCPSFFSKPILEVKKKRKGKGGKQVTYSGFGTWASHLADHEIAGVLKIWFDNHLVFDASGDDVKTYPLGPDYDLEANMRLYLGTEDQDPDPDMLAYIEARDGPGTCPAYRGTSYIYFENIPLEMLGNRFPAVMALVCALSPVPVPVFHGWYAKAHLRLVDTTALIQSWIVTPSEGDEVAFTDPGVWPGTESDEFPDGIPKSVNDDDDQGVTVYFCDPEVMDSTEVRLIEQYSFGSTPPGSKGIFTWQYWNGGAQQPESDDSVLTPALADTYGTPFPIGGVFPIYSYFQVGGGELPTEGFDSLGVDTFSTVEMLLDLVSARSGLDPADYDWSATGGLEFGGYNWTQGTGRQILEPILELFDVDVRPHDFMLEALVRGGASAGVITTGEMVRGQDGSAPYELRDLADSDLPRRIFLTYADLDADQNPNVAMPPGPDTNTAGTVREVSLDMQTLALHPDDAQRLAERRLRRIRFGRLSSQFDMTRRQLAIEPGDVWSPVFDDRAWSMRLNKLSLGANGILGGEWERDVAALAVLSASSGGPSAGYIPSAVPDDMPSLGYVMDIPLLVDAHDQSAPLAYLVAGPSEPGVWTGADYAQSETGELDSYAPAWDGIGASFGSTIGVCSDALPDALPWVPDLGSEITVTLNVGELTAATMEDLLLDPTLNLAAIRSGTGWELVQFMTPTLVAELTYTVSGFLRGVRGTEWAMDGHLADDTFALLDNAKIHTMGAAEIGDTDWYVVGPAGQNPDQDDAFSLLYTGASHKPYSPVYGTVELDDSSPGAGDILFDAVRRTRIGGASLNGQDVPLGETSESWTLDILDNTVSPVAVKRTINSASLPITYTEAMQIADWGAALDASSPIVIPEANLYQVSPPLTLRGYPLNFPEQSL